MIVAMQKIPERPGTLMRLWAGVSLGWLAALVILAGLQIEGQVQAGQEVARDVARLDCEGSTVANQCLATAQAAAGVSWSEVAAVAWEYEAAAILAWCFLPPLGLLLAALLAARVVREADRAGAPRPPSSGVQLEVVMKKSLISKSVVSMMALGAFFAGAALSGNAAAQPVGVGAGTPIGEPGILVTPPAGQSGSMASAGGNENARTGIGPGMRPGVGPPTDGLDSNPYVEAPQRVRDALGGQVNRPARRGASGTLN